jgi:hypothetical protein
MTSVALNTILGKGDKSFLAYYDAWLLCTSHFCPDKSGIQVSLCFKPWRYIWT